MNLSQLRYFVAVVDHGTFAAAAESLHLASPSVSEPVRRLEAELGLELLERDRRRLRLTPSGAALLPRAREILRAVEEAQRAMSDLRSLESGLATLGLFRNADYYGIPDVARLFLAENPGMRLNLFGQNSMEVTEAVRAGDAEAGLVVLPIPEQDLAIRPLIRDEVLYASANPERTSGTIDLETLCSRRLAVYDAHYGAEDPTRRQLATRLQEKGLNLVPVLEVERVDTALSFVTRGIADTFASSTVLKSLAPDLHAVGFDPPLYDTVAVVTRRASHPSPAGRALLELAEAHLHGLAGDSSKITLVQPS